MLVLGLPDKGAFTWIVGFVAVVLASANVVGGFVVTDRMLEMFKKREPRKPEQRARVGYNAHEPALPGHDRDLHPRAALPLEPGARAARQPDRRGRDARRDRRHVAQERADRATGRSRSAMVIGGGFGAVAARKVKMTAMPQMVALFNGVGGGAAALVSLAELHRILPEPGTPKVDIGARDRALGADRLDLVRRLDDRVREAAGADRRPADHVRRASSS